ncbi:hypothetical protein [Actinomadura monticuli]|uniref:hypothetical protein n=1 Tax=Actinomadura monticuli TaxID=3097367 RepID=UPI0035630856
MYAEERQQAILALARSKGRVDVVALSEEFSVTTGEKRRIAKAALAELPADGSIIVDAGTTTWCGSAGCPTSTC